MAISCIFVHGQPGSKADMLRLTRLLPNWITPVVFDRPGWGDSDASATGVFENADYLNRIADSIDGAKLLFGYSLGGSVALAAAIDRPDLYDRLVLYAPAAGSEAMVGIDRLLAGGLIGRSLSLAIIRVARLIVSGGVGWGQQAVVSFWREQSSLKEDMGRLECMSTTVAVPVTVVHGSNDRVVPIAASVRLVGSIPDASIVVIDGVGHSIDAVVQYQLAYQLVLSAKKIKNR